jgi:hypothetical protein
VRVDSGLRDTPGTRVQIEGGAVNGIGTVSRNQDTGVFETVVNSRVITSRVLPKL